MKRIGLDVKDLEWLRDIKEELEFSGEEQKTAREGMKRLKITSPQLFDDLIKLGCVYNKTFLLKFPTNDQVPFEFLNSFILGLIDGDGSIEVHSPRKPNRSPEYKISLTGTSSILSGVQTYFKLDTALSKRWKERNNDNYTLQISGIYNVARIILLLYKDAPSFCLKRKRDKANIILSDPRIQFALHKTRKFPKHSRAKSQDLVLIPANPDCKGV